MTLLHLVLACHEPAEIPSFTTSQLPAAPIAFARGLDGAAIVGARDGLWVGSVAYPLPGDGPVTLVHPIDADTVLAYVHGFGLYRITATSAELAEVGLDAPALGLLSSTARPTPTAAATGPDGSIWLATVGGLFRSVDGASSWSLVDLSSSGTFPVLFTDVEVFGDVVAATTTLPDSLLPESFAGLISGKVLISEDAGATWEDVGEDLPSVYASSAALGPGGLWVGTRDRGVFQYGAGGWAPLTTDGGGLDDVTSLEALPVGAVAATAHGRWYTLDAAGAPVREDLGRVVGSDGGWVALSDGTLVIAEPVVGPPLAVAGGTSPVSVAISFHVNYYHSYRGDTATDDGFGLDIDVIRNTLDWLDARPHVHADWDIENAFTLDDWMPAYSPDILERIQARVASGQDDVRLMSWNNGAVAASTREEFDAAVSRGLMSNETAFGRTVPGVQPQECMFTPDHLGWYGEHGIEWITLFNASNGFTALRPDYDLGDGARPFVMRDPQTGADLTVVPVVHHADVLDHGGLRGWVRQLQHQDQPSLLVVHFDGDAESWEQFDAELDALDGVDGVAFTTIQAWLDANPDARDPALDAVGDLADGTGDGFASWAEKSFNHEIYTLIAQGREGAAFAAALAPSDPDVAAAVAAALEPRLRALSTTHFGLAAPVLHPDRIASARAYAGDAAALGAAAKELAHARAPVGAGALQVVQPRGASGPALVDLTVSVPASALADPEHGLVVYDAAGAPVPSRVLSIGGGDPAEVAAQALITVVPGTSDLSWSWGPPEGAFGLTDADAPSIAALQSPFATCAGVTTAADAGAEQVTADARGGYAAAEADWVVDLCGATGPISRALTRWAGLPGVVVEVTGVLPGDDVIDDLQEIVLTPLQCEAASEVAWRAYGGAERARAPRAQVGAWNGQAVDGWARWACGGGALAVAHRVTERTSMAFAPVRNLGGSMLIAPLGTLWSGPAWHDGPATGGMGLGDVVVPIVGSQFHPAAPDWGGEVVTYRLLVGDGDEAVTSDVLDLFAHPPWVRSGG